MSSLRAIVDAFASQEWYATGIVLTNSRTLERKIINKGVERVLSSQEFHSLMHPNFTEEKVNVD